MNKKIKIWYELAYNKFRIEEEYTKNKTAQDFIEALKKHFNNNIKNGKIIYEGKLADISNIKIEWKSRIQEKEQIFKLNNLSTLISTITIIASMTTATFLSNQQINIEKKLLVLLFLISFFYVVLCVINELEKSSNVKTSYDSSFYEICLMVLEEFERDNKN